MSASRARTGSTSMTATWAPMPGHPRRDPPPDPAVAGDDDVAPGEQDVRRPEDPVDRRLAGAVAVVEEVLGLRLVDRDDREAERAVGGHRLEADDAGRRLLGAGEDLLDLVGPLAVEQRHEVAAVVHRDLGLGVGDGVEVARSTCRGPRRAGRTWRCRTRRRAPPRRRPSSTAGSRPRGTTSAPPALRVRIRFAVSVVTWRHAPIADAGAAAARARTARG